MISGTTKAGMQYAVKRSSSPVSYCALSIKCGTRDEEGWHSGIAHFTEHTIFKGTAHKSASKINSYLDRLGGELNAFTTKEEIVFHATVLKEDLKKAASLLMELATCPTFPQNEVCTEKSVVIDEINSYKDSPSEDIYDKFEEMLFEGHPLGRPILGTAASVKKITPEELSKFRKEKFQSGKMAFTIVANVDERKLEALANSLSEQYFPETVVASDSNVTEASITEFRRSLPPFDLSINKHNHQANCVIGNTGPSLYKKQERLATVLLCNILGGPASNSILNSVLREKNGWVYGVECTYTQYADTGIVTICIGCDKDNLDKCVDATMKEILKLQSSPLSARKLREAKKQLLGQLAISSDNGETQCLSMGKSLMSWRMVTPDDQVRRSIEGITAEEVQRMAVEIFDKEKLCKLIYL